jgi:hypothetical protein
MDFKINPWVGIYLLLEINSTMNVNPVCSCLIYNFYFTKIFKKVAYRSAVGNVNPVCSCQIFNFLFTKTFTKVAFSSTAGI